MTEMINPSLFSRTVNEVRDKLQSEERVTASQIVAAIAASHPEYGKHIAHKLELDTQLGQMRPVDEWLMGVLGVYSPDLMEKRGQPVINGRLVIRALVSLDPSLLEQPLMESFIKKLEDEISPILLDLPAFKTPRVHDVTLKDSMGVNDSVEQRVIDARQTEEGDKTSASIKAGGTLSEQPEEIRAGYWADGEIGKDRLNLDREVDTLASVLCDDEIVPPLSVGLFGDWGSGKSFFMHLLRKRVALFAEAARAAEERGEKSLFCSHVRQITFNSWHYSDANLWASLVTHIFDSLAVDEEAYQEQSEAERNRAVDKRNNLLQELDSAKRLKHELEEAESKSEDLDKNLARVLDDFWQQSVDKLIKGSANEGDKEVLDTLGSVKEMLGLEDLRVAQLQTVVDDGRNLGRALISIWHYLEYGKKLQTAAWLFAVAIFVWWISDQLAVAEYLKTFFITLAGWSAILTKPVKNLRSAAEGTKKLLSALKRQKTEEARRLQREKARLEQRIQDLERDYSALTSGGRFAQLVEERAQGDSYRKQLGVISMIHRDFKQMSDLLLQSRNERRTAQPTQAANGSEQEESSKTPEIPRIDRIILYIDDLDRCRAKRVVEVLEAVHLLLAEPLFVVVVGVDPRWLLRSLEKHYTGLLTTSDGDLNPDEAADWQSTPMNYLEKIFQIPYTLSPMDKTGFERLMESLMPIPMGEEELARHDESPDDYKKGLVEITTGEPAGDGWRELYENIVRENAERRQAEEAGKTPQEIAAMRREDERELQASLRQTLLKKIDLRPGKLLIDSSELAFMKELGPLIGTPRAAKRLSNIYRLLRASLDSVKLKQLVDPQTGSGDYPAVQILLAIVVGYPRLATFVFQKLHRAEDAENWDKFISGLRPREEKEEPLGQEDERKVHSGAIHNSARAEMTPDEARLWNRLCDRLEQIAGKTGETFPQELEIYRRWIFKVARYSFHTGRLVVSNQEQV